MNNTIGILIAIAGSLAFSQPAGTIRGTVKNGSSQPVAGAHVIARPAASNTSADAKDAHGSTDKSGNFTINGVAAGKYSVCIEDDEANVHVDPCHWSSPVQVSVSAGQAISNVAVPVVAGTTLQVRIQDPYGLANPRAAANEIFLAVVLPGGKPIPLKVTANDPFGKTFQIPIPAATYQLVVISKKFLITDGKGSQLEDKEDGNGNRIAPHLTIPIAAGAKNSLISLYIVKKL